MGVEMLPTAGPSLPAPPPVFSLYHIPPTLSAFTVDYLSKLFSAVPKPSAMLKLPDRPVDSRKFPEFRYFIRTLLINGRISADTLVHALIYLSRFHRKVSRQRALVEEGAKHKLFLAALLVASKFCDDRWPLATIVVCDFLPQGLLSCSEVNRMERAFLRIIGYKLVVDPDELALLLNKHGIDIREIARIIHQRLGKAGMRVPPVPPPRVSPPAQSLVPMLPPPMPSRAKSAGLISSVLAGRPVPWFDLAYRFKLPQSDMEQIVALDDDRLQKRREQSARVTQLADQAFDSQHGRCDWDSVVKDLDMPLMECLDLFDVSLSSVPVRSLPKFMDWLPDDFPLLKGFVQQFPGTLTADEWRLVSAFMNIKLAGCVMAYSMCIHPRMTTELFELIASYHWARVSESVGLSERECLEANQFGDGKAWWIYDPNTFSWDMANRMTAFIQTNYPRPLPVNYTAVSNYMWIERDDCIKMAGLLRGEMTWTKDAVAKVVELRNQGMMYKDIARQLSPNLTAEKVSYAYLAHIFMQLHTLPTKLGCKLRM
ncbi:PHO85 cyclin-1 [Coemansia sp. RSA 2610]|nr:PHO85 cyclin-1 [Coemansia sp. RSA 2610]